MILPPPTSTLFPYTTLFRSAHRSHDRSKAACRKSATPAGCDRPHAGHGHATAGCVSDALGTPQLVRSEEHTSELQSPYDLVCRLLLEKKKKIENKKV